MMNENSNGIKFTGWGMLEHYLEEERKFYNLSISSLGSLYDYGWLPAFNTSRVREVADSLFQTTHNYFMRLHELTSLAIKEIPAMERELEVMGRLNTEVLEPTREIISATQEKGKKFSIEEWANITDNLSRVRIYMEYRDGINLIRENSIIFQQHPRDLVRTFKVPLYAFERKWNETYYIGPGFNFINFCAVDSHDNTLLPKLLKEKNSRKRKEIMLNEIPEEGLKRVVLTPQIDKIKASLSTRKHEDIRSKLCTVSSLRMRLDRERFKNYIKEIFRLSNLLDSLFYIS
ncbi:MAG: hypothetical protein QW609_02045 [Candidatus Aenigmatarchaeota archaeon]